MMTKYLLDTHVIIWILNNDTFLTKNVREIVIEKPTFLSMVSIWEIAIKSQLKKLSLDVPISRIENEMKNRGEVATLPISTTHIANLSNLEFIHRDPFDRLLISRAQMEDFTLVTKDENIPKYPIKTYWK